MPDLEGSFCWETITYDLLHVYSLMGKYGILMLNFVLICLSLYSFYLFENINVLFFHSRHRRFGRTQFSSSMKFMTEALDAIQLQHLRYERVFEYYSCLFIFFPNFLFVLSYKNLSITRIISFDFPESVSSSPFECRYKLLLRDVSSEHSFVVSYSF